MVAVPDAVGFAPTILQSASVRVDGSAPDGTRSSTAVSPPTRVTVALVTVRGSPRSSTSPTPGFCPPMSGRRR